MVKMKESHNISGRYFARNIDSFIEKVRGRAPSKIASHQVPLFDGRAQAIQAEEVENPSVHRKHVHMHTVCELINEKSMNEKPMTALHSYCPQTPTSRTQEKLSSKMTLCNRWRNAITKSVVPLSQVVSELPCMQTIRDFLPIEF